MARRFVAAVGLACSLAFSASSQAMVESIGPGEGQLDIVAWPGYIERGETDKAYDWVTGFEAKTGCKVNVKNLFVERPPWRVPVGRCGARRGLEGWPADEIPSLRL